MADKNRLTMDQAQRCLDKMRMQHRHSQIIGSNYMSKAVALREEGTLVVHAIDKGGPNGEERHWVFVLPRGGRKLQLRVAGTVNGEAARIFFETLVDTGSASIEQAIEQSNGQVLTITHWMR